jgi:hypothetical protein
MVNDWEGRLVGMDLEIRLVLKKNLPSFVFETDEAKDGGDVTTAADTPSATNTHHQGKRADGKEAGAPLPEENPDNESSPSLDDFGSPVKRKRRC